MTYLCSIRGIRVLRCHVFEGVVEELRTNLPKVLLKLTDEELSRISSGTQCYARVCRVRK